MGTKWDLHLAQFPLCLQQLLVVLPAPHLTLEVSAPSQACLVPWSQHCHVQSDCFTSLAHTLLPFMPWNNLLVLRYCVDYRLYLFQASIRTAALWSCLFRVPEDYEENVLFPWEMTQAFSPFTLTDFFSLMLCIVWTVKYETERSYVLMSFRKCMHYLAYCRGRMGQVWIIPYCRKTHSLFCVIIKPASTESFSLQVGNNTGLLEATW